MFTAKRPRVVKPRPSGHTVKTSPVYISADKLGEEIAKRIPEAQKGITGVAEMSTTASANVILGAMMYMWNDHKGLVNISESRGRIIHLPKLLNGLQFGYKNCNLVFQVDTDLDLAIRMGDSYTLDSQYVNEQFQFIVGRLERRYDIKEVMKDEIMFWINRVIFAALSLLADGHIVELSDGLTISIAKGVPYIYQGDEIVACDKVTGAITHVYNSKYDLLF